MSDLLASASLLLTAITVLYGLWYPAIKEALEVPVPDYKSQAKKPIEKVSSAIWKRAVPLTAAAYAIVLVFSVDALGALLRSVKSVYSTGIYATLAGYDAVATAFVVVVGFSFALAIHLSFDCWSLIAKKQELQSVQK